MDRDVREPHQRPSTTCLLWLNCTGPFMPPPAADLRHALGGGDATCANETTMWPNLRHGMSVGELHVGAHARATPSPAELPGDYREITP